ncbi:RHS repeat-associated core domain-containing protein [Microbacterium sp. M1A1_1b]
MIAVIGDAAHDRRLRQCSSRGRGRRQVDPINDLYGTDTVSENGGDDGLPSDPFGFKAGIDDNHTGLVKFGLRWYNPDVGSWTQQDTLDRPLDPSNGDRYAYAGGGPINSSDPTGSISFSLFAKLLVAVVTGKDVYTVLGPSTRTEGLSTDFSIACGLVAGAIAVPTVAGALLALGGCCVATKLVENALEEEG